MKKTIMIITVLMISLTSFGQWTTLITDPANDQALINGSPGLDGTSLEYMYDAINDNVMFRITCTNLAAHSTTPSADFNFSLPNGLDSGNGSALFWSSSTPVHKTAACYTATGGSAPSNYTYGQGWHNVIEETATFNSLCASCVTIYTDVPANTITYTMPRTGIITNTEMGGNSATIGLVMNVGNNVSWSDAITNTSGGASAVTFTINLSSNPGPVLVSSIGVTGQGGVSTISNTGGNLQMIAAVLPANADDNTVAWSVQNGTGMATIGASGLLTAVTDGTVTVTATANDGSGVMGNVVITISNQTNAISSFSISPFLIYPNPTENLLTISTESINAMSIEILSLGGEIIMNESINSKLQTIDVSNLDSGVYIVFVSSDSGEKWAKRFIKQ
ncbi:MAG: T9SS type A sorting domain-containing protein [Crocinitomicaceae bacterium]|nr:T9SS type A sorting domain-containing protein [Flavobacteriales bacterium]NQZ38414.1 T9SS type A sorting domain-containing protein [Crocinitomicaceae bacterium]